MINPRCTAGDITSSPLACNGASARAIATVLAINAKPVPSCTAFCMPLRKPAVPARILHRRAVVGFILAGRECHARHWLYPDEMIPHALDAGNVFGRDDEARTLAIIGDHSVQFRDAVLDNHVDSRRPIL